MRKAWARLQAWLRREEYVRAVVAEAAKNGYLEGHAAGLTVGQQAGYQIGRAHGELIGREQQVLELQQEFGLDDNRNIFGPDDALRYGTRLRH